MKSKIIFLLLPVVLLGCSREQSVEKSQASLPSSAQPVERPEIRFIDSPETKEKVEMKHQALALFTNRDYDGLEKMAETYRQSKAEFADGYEKIYSVYGGLDLELEDSEQTFQQRQIQMQDWIRAKPDSPTPRIEMARILIDYAWKARGTDWAKNVKQQDWQTFGARLQGAVKYLQDAANFGYGVRFIGLPCSERLWVLMPIGGSMTRFLLMRSGSFQTTTVTITIAPSICSRAGVALPVNGSRTLPNLPTPSAAKLETSSTRESCGS